MDPSADPIFYAPEIVTQAKVMIAVAIVMIAAIMLVDTALTEDTHGTD